MAPAAGHAFHEALLIDGLTPAEILSKLELKRIGQKIPAQWRGDVIAAEALGREVYEHNRFAEAAAELVAPGGHASFAGNPAGWITERTPAGFAVYFLVNDKGKLRVSAEVKQRSKKEKPEMHRFAKPRPLSGKEALIWHARQMAFTATFRACAKHYDPVVIPLQARGKKYFYVYLLPAASKRDLMYFGGYFRITISDDATEILETHAFTHSCITLHKNPRATAAVITEVLSDAPTTPQVYANLAYRLPLKVETAGNSAVWLLKEGRISYAAASEQD